MSYMQGETYGQNTATNQGPIDPKLRKKGIIHRYFSKFFDKYEAEQLQIDILAISEVFDDITTIEKAQMKELYTGVINSLRNIYTRANKVVCLDRLLLRLYSRAIINIAIVLYLGRWIARLQLFAETKLAKRVVLKIEDSVFDLDKILIFFYEIVNNEDYRYFNLFTRLRLLRSTLVEYQHQLKSPLRPNSRERSLFINIYLSYENRDYDILINQARALFLVLDLKQQTRQTLN